MEKGLIKGKKKEIIKQKRMLGLASCLGRQHQKDNLVEDQSTKMHKQVDQLSNQPLDQSLEASPQIQASSPSERREPENPDDQVKLRTEVIDDIVRHLKMRDVCKVILHGKEGVGKTWIAKEVAKQSILNHIVDVTIWIYLNRRESILVQELKNLSPQLSLQQEFDGAVYYYRTEEDDDDEKTIIYPDVSTISSMRDKMKGRKCLLVLDDGNSERRVEEVLNLLERILNTESKNITKILVTRLEATDDKITTSNDMITESNSGNSNRCVVEIKPLTLPESKDLLQKTCSDNHIGVVRDDDVEEIVKLCNYLPAAIVFTGNVLGYALKNDPNELNKELAIREAKKQQGDDYWALGYEKFINNVTILRCFWLSREYLEERGSIHYDQLILYWLLEGYFDENTSLEQGYANAHNVLIDLLDAGILGEREAGYVVLERAGVNFANFIFPLLCEKIITRLDIPYSILFQHDNYGANVKRLNGSIAAFKVEFVEVTIVILFVKGNSISGKDGFRFSIEHDPTNGYYFAIAKSLKILYVSHVELSLCLAGMSALEVLILRNCYLTNFQILNICKDLRVLEISNCEMLDKIPDNFLADHKSSLVSLNLSVSSPTKSILRPGILLGLWRLRHLFLRCTLLESFPDVTGLEELEVLDLSGAKFESLKKKVWNLELPKLKILDLSETYIYEFPGLVNLKNLTYLLLKNCPLLNKLRPVTTLTKLQVIVASGCSGLYYFRETNLPSGNCLRKLDLSKTMIRKIPYLKNAINLVYLCLSGCHQLKELPPIEGAKNLRLLDVSDAIQLEKIHTSFQDMKSLRDLFLSNTKVKTLPPLSGLESLQKLVLKGCESLQSIPECVGLLTNLLLLDLRGCVALETLLDEQLSHVTVLKS